MPTRPRRPRPCPVAVLFAAVAASTVAQPQSLADPPQRTTPAGPAGGALPAATSEPGRVRVDYDRFLDQTAVRLDAGPFALAFSHPGREPADGAVEGVDLLVAAGPRRVTRVIFLVDGVERIAVGDREGPSRLNPAELARMAGAFRSLEAALFTEGDGRTEYTFTPADRAGLTELHRRAGRAAVPTPEPTDRDAATLFTGKTGKTGEAGETGDGRGVAAAPEAVLQPVGTGPPSSGSPPVSPGLDAATPATPAMPEPAAAPADAAATGVVRPVVVVLDQTDWALQHRKPLVAAEVRRAFDGLRDGQKFNLIVLGVEVKSFGAWPVPPTAANAGRLNDFLAGFGWASSVRATFVDGMRSAVAQRPSAVVLITDGEITRDYPTWQKDVALVARIFEATGTELHLVLTGDTDSPSRDALERIARRNGSVRSLQPPEAVPQQAAGPKVRPGR